MVFGFLTAATTHIYLQKTNGRLPFRIVISALWQGDARLFNAFSLRVPGWFEFDFFRNAGLS